MSLARTLGLDGDAITSLHDGYFERLIAAAIDDGVVTTNERRDIDAVGRLLGFDDEHVRDALARNDPKRSRHTPATGTRRGPSLSGKRVCFTGESVCSYQGQPLSRELAAELASSAGLEIADSVTKKLDVLVVADPIRAATVLARVADERRNHRRRKRRVRVGGSRRRRTKRMGSATVRG